MGIEGRERATPILFRVEVKCLVHVTGNSGSSSGSGAQGHHMVKYPESVPAPSYNWENIMLKSLVLQPPCERSAAPAF